MHNKTFKENIHMFKKIISMLLKGNTNRRYSSSSHQKYSQKHNYYGHKHYKKQSRSSIFSSKSFFSS